MLSAVPAVTLSHACTWHCWHPEQHCQACMCRNNEHLLLCSHVHASNALLSNMIQQVQASYQAGLQCYGMGQCYIQTDSQWCHVYNASWSVVL